MSHDTKGCSRFCMILRDNRRNLEVCICTLDTLPTRAWYKFHTSVEIGDDLLWNGHVCIWAILGEFRQLRWFSTNCPHYLVMCHGRNSHSCFFPSYPGFEKVLTDIERYWGNWQWFRWFNQHYLILVLGRKTQFWFSEPSVNNKCKIRFPVYTRRKIRVD